jgi:IS30 family transposase
MSYVEKQLKAGWSPEQIAGRLPIDYPGEHIDDDTIYRYIYRDDVHYRGLWKCLPRARRKRKKRGQRGYARLRLANRLSIDERPASVAERLTFGHWETDNVVGIIGEKEVLSVTVERLSRFTLLKKCADKGAAEKAQAIVGRLSYFPTSARQSITTDNGNENAEHAQVSESLQLPVYFCHPYAAWEKGTVENINGRIRRVIPKGALITHYSHEAIGALEKRLNTTPRKCLGFRTPLEKLHELLGVTGDHWAFHPYGM